MKAIHAQATYCRNASYLQTTVLVWRHAESSEKPMRFCHLEQNVWHSCGPPPVCQSCLTGQSYQLLLRHRLGAFLRQVLCGHVLLSVWNLLTHLAWCPQVPRVPAKEQIRSNEPFCFCIVWDFQLFAWNLIDRDRENKRDSAKENICTAVQCSSDIIIVLNRCKFI